MCVVVVDRDVYFAAVVVDLRKVLLQLWDRNARDKECDVSQT